MNKKLIATIAVIIIGLIVGGYYLYDFAYKSGNKAGQQFMLGFVNQTIVERLQKGEPIPFSITNERGEKGELNLVPLIDEKGQIIIKPIP